MKKNIYATVKVKGIVLYCAAFKRGGNWNNGANAGAFTLNLNNTPSNTNTNIGFRCASDHIPRQNVWCKFTDLHPGFTMITELFPLRLSWRNIEPVFFCVFLKIHLVNRIGFYVWDEIVSPQSFAVSALKRAHAVTYYV